LFLILTFVNAAGLFIMTGAEFLGLLLIVVYVGAVAVLFLFVVMMLDVDFAELREGYLQYMPVGAFVGAIVLIELLAVVGSWIVAPGATTGQVAPIPDVNETRNIEALGNILYTDYILFFQLSGMILLVAMVGAIVLTLRHKPGVRRQNIAEQVARDPNTAIELRKVKPGQGL
ncbi:MAG: NADH-quinone oxidoreductase subunit J, partial [Rhizobiaceae bacterium]|nr:NADH-quinone oxidoreductase subunit J [Rhizobiaceae bacterium]